jgi:hypothetical protein
VEPNEAPARPPSARTSRPPLREIALADGRVLQVRAADPGDVPRLLDLYRSLTPEERHRRFFSGSLPRRNLLERWVQGGRSGGACLVAEVATGTESVIVGEVGYAVLADGDGELGITVAPSWRGWLAPYLLDALLEVAAANGVPNIQAEVLVENRPMLRLTRARGQAILDDTDATALRVSISTRGGPPSWPGPRRRPRILIELCAGTCPVERAARAASYEVVGCPGPPAGHAERCPLLSGAADCPLVDGADVVVVVVRPGDERAERILAAHRVRGAGAPVAAEVWPDTAVAAAGADPAAVAIPASAAGEAIQAVLRALVGSPPSG